MATTKTLVEIEHDTIYSGVLLSHMSQAFGSKNIHARRVLNGVALLYDKELWQVDKTVIYNAISALSEAVGYVQNIETDVPSWQRTLKQDLARMESALESLRKVGIPLDTPKQQALSQDVAKMESRLTELQNLTIPLDTSKLQA